MLDILCGHGGFEDECNRDAGASKEERLLAADAVEDEDDEEEICRAKSTRDWHSWRSGAITSNRADTVVNAGDEQVAASGDTQVCVYDRLIIADDVDSGHLCENLDECCVHQTSPPLWNLEHHEPSGCHDCLFCLNCHLDLGEFRLQPLFVASIIVEFAQLSTVSKDLLQDQNCECIDYRVQWLRNRVGSLTTFIASSGLSFSMR